MHDGTQIPHRSQLFERTLRLVAIVAGSWLAAHPCLLWAQTECDAPRSAPAASFNASCSSGTCSFALTSPVPPSGISSLEWDFGDGSFADGPSLSTSHTYGAGGYYLVTLTLTAVDGETAVATGGVTIGGPQVPLASDDSLSTAKDTPLTISTAELLSNDAPGVTFYQGSAKCQVPIGGDSCTYTPPPGFVGTDSFTYSVIDAGSTVGTATVTITVRQVLVANPDTFTTTIGVPILINSSQLLLNDTAGAVFVRAENPDAGTLEFVNTTSQGAVYRFTPAPQFAGTASFEYLISWDGNPPYERGFVYINVIDAPPHAQFTVACVNRTCTVHPTSWDDIGIQTYQWNWGDGTPVIQPTTPYPWADQTHTYSASGRYTITHTVIDTVGQSNSLALDVVANTAPVAANDSATTERDIPVTINVLTNDTDADGDALSIASVTIQNPGAAYQVVPSGSSWAIKVTPPDSFVGTLTFTYVANDRWGASATATVTLTVTQWSVVVDALGEQFYCSQNGSIRIPLGTLLSNDYDSAGAPLSIIAFDTSILMGTLDCTTDPTACTYRPPINAYGYTLFRYTASDPVGRHDTATVRIYVGNHGSPPTAHDDYFTTVRNTPKAFTIQDIVQNDVDPDGDTLTVGLLSGARAYGSLSCSTPMYVCTYTPNAGFVGTDRFSYTATDSMNPQVSASINMLTLPPPTPTFDAREDVVVTGVNQQAFFSNGSLTSNDFNPSGGTVTVTAVNTTGLIGSLVCDSFGCTYNPPFSFQGTTTFRYTASDGHGGTDTAVVRIRVGGTNNPPVAVADTLSTPKNTALRFSVFDLLKNDYDPDNDPLTVSVYTSTAHKGTLNCGTPSYWCTYTPAANVTGADSITYLLSDGSAAVTSTVTINILP